MSFNTDSLESMCELIVDCPHSTPEWTDSGVIVLRNQNIKNGNLDLSSPSYTTQKDFEGRIKRAAPTEGDIVLTREAPMGEVCRIPKGIKCCLGQRQVLLRPKKGVDGDYLFWALQSPFVQNQIAWSEGTGSTVSNLRIPLIKALKIPRFDRSEGNIGKILNGLWEKIHLNTQTNQTLESIAQAIFKSWFVDFEPVKAKMAALAEGGTREQAELAAMRAISGKSEAELARLQQQNPEHYQQLAETAALFPSAMIESELGEIPEGWEVQNYSNLCKKIESGGTPKRNEDSYWNGEVSWLSSGEVRDKVVINTKEKITIEGLKNSSAKLWPKNTTVIAMYGATAGEACLLAEEMSANQACCGLIPKTEFTSFLYLSAIRSSQLLAEKASGSAQQNLNKGIIENHNLIAPPSDLAQQFEHTVQFMILELIENYRENFSLAKLRDTLLPKLLSGEIDLSDIQSEVA